MSSMAGITGSGAAKRRRGRQLRAVHQHEQLSVNMALETALHHSAEPAGPVVGGLREEAGHETHSGLRAPTPMPPGEWPAPLSEVAGPQRSDRTVRHSSGALSFTGFAIGCKSIV